MKVDPRRAKRGPKSRDRIHFVPSPSLFFPPSFLSQAPFYVPYEGINVEASITE